ncbi:MAG: hypothetical protein RL172_1738 [Bacteroidota bacterium]
MYFSSIINAAVSNDADRPLMQKELYPVAEKLQQYLLQYQRDIALPVQYKELFYYRYTNAIKNEQGRPTHWENVVYDTQLLQSLEPRLVQLFLLLYPAATHNTFYKITAIDFCEYANSMPFRITLCNSLSSTQYIYYIKAADASRLYGLELEALLTNNPVHFLYHQQTLVETHIAGIPGDDFLHQLPLLTVADSHLLAQAFIQFNEQCFARLLGDMRSYNFVVAPTATGGFCIRAIDFDQQCYEGRLNLYLPQFYKENYAFVALVKQLLQHDAIEYIRMQQRRQLASHLQDNHQRISHLLQVMSQDELSENYKVLSLKKELNSYYGTTVFSQCQSMGSVTATQLALLLQLTI